MEKNSNYQDLIEKYLDGTLSTEELKSFEEQINTDPVLSKELLNRKIIQENWVKADKKEKVRQHIKHVIKTGKSGSISRNTIWLSAAASLVVILGISSMLFFQRGQNQRDREFLSKGNNSNLEQAIIQGQQNEIKEYGSIEYSNNSRNETYKKFLPNDGAIYSVNDTITFIWPTVSYENQEPLIILDEEGQKVVEIKLRTGDIGYKLLPSRLKPGSYTYILQPKVQSYKFSINK